MVSRRHFGHGWRARPSSSSVFLCLLLLIFSLSLGYVKYTLPIMGVNRNLHAKCDFFHCFQGVIDAPPHLFVPLWISVVE